MSPSAVMRQSSNNQEYRFARRKHDFRRVFASMGLVVGADFIVLRSMFRAYNRGDFTVLERSSYAYCFSQSVDTGV